MIVKVRDILAVGTALESLSSLFLSKQTKMDLKRFSKNFAEELQVAKEILDDIYARYGIESENDLKSMDPTRAQKMESEIDELMDCDCQLKDFSISLDEIEEYENEIPASLLLSLEFLLRSDI